jgi:hypothetical protein
MKHLRNFSEGSKYSEEEHINTIQEYTQEISRNINRIEDADVLQEIEFELSGIIHKFNLLDDDQF